MHPLCALPCGTSCGGRHAQAQQQLGKGQGVSQAQGRPAQGPDEHVRHAFAKTRHLHALSKQMQSHAACKKADVLWDSQASSAKPSAWALQGLSKHSRMRHTAPQKPTG